MLGIDLFYLKKDNYLFVVDYFFCYFEIFKLKNIILQLIVNYLKLIFVRYGILDILVLEYGLQYFSLVYQIFFKDYGFRY